MIHAKKQQKTQKQNQKFNSPRICYNNIFNYLIFDHDYEDLSLLFIKSTNCLLRNIRIVIAYNTCYLNELIQNSCRIF